MRMSWNMKLASWAGVVSAVCAYRLYVTSVETGNWHGAGISFAHVMILALGVLLSLWQHGADNDQEKRA